MVTKLVGARRLEPATSCVTSSIFRGSGAELFVKGWLRGMGKPLKGKMVLVAEA
jgi:hypothetical protein